MSTPELLPCPFCDSPAAMSVLEGDEPGDILSAWVSCACGIEMHERRTEAEAAMGWNARAPGDAKNAEVEPARHAQQTWQPIETAPKDGTFILVNDTRYNRDSFIARWNDCKNHIRGKAYWEFADERVHGVGMSRANQPTHWMPLPASPVVLDSRGTPPTRSPLVRHDRGSDAS